MSNQNTTPILSELPSNQHTLYFNPNYQSGFELCEQISSSDRNILYRPINLEDGLIYSKISQQGQDYQIKHIKLYNIITAILQKEQIIQQNEEQREPNHDESFENLIAQDTLISSLLSQIQDYPSSKEIEIILRQNIDRQIFEFGKVHDDSVTFCLIYDNQELSQINTQIERFKQIFGQNRQTNIIIVINGKEKHKLHDIFQFEENINENKCNICYSYEYQECIFFVIYEEQSSIKLLNWIYNGIFKHFQSEYFYVSFLSIQINIEKFLSMDQMMIQSKYCGSTGYYNLIENNFRFFNRNNSFVGYMNFLNYQFQIDSLVQLKKFHNPFFSYYKWNDCYKYLNLYITELEKENQSGNINLHLNSLLPSLMFHLEEKEFFSASSNLGEKEILQVDSVEMFLDLSNKIKCIIQCNDSALSSRGCIYKFILILRYFETKVKLAEILFLYTFAPYQFFYLNMSNTYLQILLTALWPLLLFILILMFVLLVQQYSIGVSIVKKKIRSIYFRLINDILEIQFKSEIHQFNILEYWNGSKPIIIKNKQNYYRFEQLIKELKQHLRNKQRNIIQQNQQTDQNIIQVQQFNEPNQQEQSFQFQNTQSEQIFKFTTQIVSEKKVDKIYEVLFQKTLYVQIFCSLTVIINLILTYGNNFIFGVQNQQQYVTIIGVFIFIAIFLLRNLSLKKNQIMRSFVMTFHIFFNLLITIVYSEMYHLLRIKIKPKDYRRQIKKLSQYFCLNILFLIIFYIVETSMNFEGYIFSIIIFYNLTIYLIDSLMVIVAILKEFFMSSGQRPKNVESEMKEYRNEKFLKNYKKIILKYLQDFRNNKKNQKQEEEIKSKSKIDKSEISISKNEMSDQDLIPPGDSYTFEKEIYLGFDLSNEFELN